MVIKLHGVTTMLMDIGMDTGDILLTKETSIKDNETTGELFERLAIIGGELLNDTLNSLENNTIIRKKQEESFTIAPMITKEMCNIDWKNLTAAQIKNLVRGLNPILGARCVINDNIYKIWKVEIIEFANFNYDVTNNKIGEIILENEKQGLFIKAKDGIISVLEIQGPNGKKMPIKDFLRGNKINIVK